MGGYPFEPGAVKLSTTETVRVQRVRSDVEVVNAVVDFTVRDVRQRVQEARELVAGQIAEGRGILTAASADVTAARAAAASLAADVAAARTVVAQLVTEASQARGVFATLNQRLTAIENRLSAVEVRLPPTP